MYRHMCMHISQPAAPLAPYEQPSGALGRGLAPGRVARPALGDIVVLSLRVSLTAVASPALIGLPLGARSPSAAFPARRTLIVAAERADGPAAGRGRAGGLPAAVARRAARRAGAAVHADGDGDRADDPDHADHRRAGAPGRRGRVARIPRAAALAGRDPARRRRRRCSGTCASRWSRSCSPASAARRPKSAR